MSNPTDVNMLIDDDRWKRVTDLSERVSAALSDLRGEEYDPAKPLYGPSRVVREVIVYAMTALEGEYGGYEPDGISRSRPYTIYFSAEVLETVDASRRRIDARRKAAGRKEETTYIWMARTAIDLCLDQMGAEVMNNLSAVPIVHRGRRRGR